MAKTTTTATELNYAGQRRDAPLLTGSACLTEIAVKPRARQYGFPVKHGSLQRSLGLVVVVQELSLPIVGLHV